MSPSKLAQKTGIPRPRAYDVLRSLIEKGLLTEQSGKPQVYGAIEPERGLKNLLSNIEMETSRHLEEKKRVVQMLTKLLSQMYEKSKRLKTERSKVWFTQRDTAFISIYSEAIRSCEKEISIASTDPNPPEKEILESVKFALKNGKSVRVVRQVTELWTEEELERYEEVIKSGSQVRYLDIEEIPLRFAVFDGKDVILVFPSEAESPTTQTIEALWLRIPPLAKILLTCFEELWKKGKPMLPILRDIRKKKQVGRS
jgi:sugar-specific transcriptional regulator TrmB